MLHYEEKNRRDAGKAMLPFDPSLVYAAYAKKVPGGGWTTLLALKSSYSVGVYDSHDVDVYEMAAGAIVDRKIKQAELLDYRRLGTISGHGANVWAKTGENLIRLIEVYGNPAKRRPFWRRWLGW